MNRGDKMLTPYEYDRANSYYVKGLIEFHELVAIIKGERLLRDLERERLYEAA